MPCAALIPHPQHYVGDVVPELIDEAEARRILYDYDNGAYMVVQRVEALFSLTGHWQSLNRWLAPKYCELRDYLHREHHVALVLAARLALAYTKPLARLA